MIESEKNDRSGIYAYTQRKLAYNSNKIEGSTLTEKQTASIFETGTIVADGTIFRTKDIEEMTGHFTMFNHIYNKKANHSIEDIAEFHAKFKKIHPFQDGNG